MAITGDALERLQTKLLVSGVRDKVDMALYEIIRDLIRYLRQTSVATSTIIDGPGGGGGGLLNADYITYSDQTGVLPNSKELVAGAGIVVTETPTTIEVSATASGSGLEFGTATIDFGATLCDYAETAVIGQTTIQADARVFVFLMGATTVDSDEEDHLQGIVNMELVAGIPVAGVGFTIYSFITQGLTKGTYDVQWFWSNP